MTGIRIGVDVGGTNTDAVVMAGSTLRGWAKTPTTTDVTGGIVASVREALARAQTAPTEVRAIMIGTTHFTNAVVERRRLEPTAAVRLGLPATASVPPFADWPADLRAAIGGSRLPRPRRLRVRRSPDLGAGRGRAPRDRQAGPRPGRHLPGDLRRLQPDPPRS